MANAGGACAETSPLAATVPTASRPALRTRTAFASTLVSVRAARRSQATAIVFASKWSARTFLLSTICLTINTCLIKSSLCSCSCKDFKSWSTKGGNEQRLRDNAQQQKLAAAHQSKSSKSPPGVQAILNHASPQSVIQTRDDLLRPMSPQAQQGSSSLSVSL